jgi:O-antigen/teichoic acid export membrane protein
VISRKVVPQVHVKISNVTSSVLYELFRFGGSYQLVNLLEVLYVAIVPVTVLRAFGDNAAGTYALVTRVVASAVMLQDAFVLPILSGGTMVFATGSAEKMRSLVTKAFKATLALALPPLAFVSAFGGLMVKAWTGQTNSDFPVTFLLVSLSSLFSAYSLVALVLYRASGKAVMDNVRQVLRIVTLLSVTVFASKLGFFGTLSGLALSNLVGMIFMMYAMEKTFHAFEARMILPDALRITLATAAIVAAGALAAQIPLPTLAWANERMAAVFQLGVISLACLAVALPAFALTGSMTAQEGRTLLQVVLPQRNKIAIPATGRAGDQ